MNTLRRIFALLFVMLLVSMCSSNIPLNFFKSHGPLACAEGGLVTVNAAGGGDSPTIQGGVNAANTGDTVFIFPGTYNENVLVSGKSIRLEGANVNTVIINGGGPGNCIKVEDDNNLIANITTTNGKYGIFLDSSDSNFIFNVNSSGNKEGIHLELSDHNLLSNITCRGNDDKGLYLEQSENNSIANCTLENNANIGVDLYYSSNNTMNNTVLVSDGLKMRSARNTRMENSTISTPANVNLNFVSDSNITLLNTTFDKTRVTLADGQSALTVNWYLHISVNNTIGQPVEGGEVRLLDNPNGSFDNTLTTDMDGSINNTILTEYTQDSNGKTFLSPYNLTVTKVNYHTAHAVSEPMMTGTTTVKLTLIDSKAPVADAGADRTVDQHTNVVFNAGGSSDNLRVENYTWNFTYDETPVLLYGPAPEFVFHTASLYRVELNISDPDGNRGLDVVNITVRDITLPLAHAGPDIIIDQHEKVTFNGSGSSDNVGIIHYNWTFQYNGSEMSLAGNVRNFTFHIARNYEVKLNVTDREGNWNADTINVIVIDITRPVADAGKNITVDQHDTVIFFNLQNSTDDSYISSYNWSFTYDGTEISLTYDEALPDTPENITAFTFRIPGIYVVTLKVTDGRGNWATDFITVTVLDIEEARAHGGNDIVIDQHENVLFNGSGSRDNVAVANWTWTFTYNGSTQTVYGMYANFTFTEAGYFTVHLSVKDSGGNMGPGSYDTVNVTVRDITLPVVRAGDDRTIDQNTKVRFHGGNCSDNVGIAKYSWTFRYDGENVTLTGITPDFQFDLAGDHTISLNVSDEAGNWARDVIVISVNDTEKPTADAGMDVETDQDETIWFDGSQSTDNTGIVNYEWRYYEKNAVQIFSGRRIQVPFHVPGTYTVTLNVTDKTGNWATDDFQATVRDIVPPVADAGANHALPAGSNYHFNGSNSSDNGWIANYTWTLIYDGNTVRLYGKAPTFRFDLAGVYNVTLQVIDGGDHEALDNLIITVHDDSEEDGNKSDMSLIDFWWIVFAILVILGSAIFIVLFRRRGRNSGARDRGGEAISLEGTEDEADLDELPSGPIIPLDTTALARREVAIKGGPVISHMRTEGRYRSDEDEIVSSPVEGVKKYSKVPSVTVAVKSVTCKICFGVIKMGLPMVRCRCGKRYHDSCAKRVGECPACDFDFSHWGEEKREAGKKASDFGGTIKAKFDPDSVFIPKAIEPWMKKDLCLPQAKFIDLEGKEKKLPIDEIFLMTAGGLLIEHYTFNKTTELNEDVLSSMLMAVTNFMCDSLSPNADTDSGGNELHKIEYGKISVMFASGKEISIVGMVSGPKKESVHGDLKKAVEKIEKKYKKVLKGWDGDMEKLEGVKKYLEKLVLGEYKN